MAENGIKTGFLGNLFGGLLGGIAGIGQGLIQRQTDRLNAERNFAQNMEMSKYQYSKDLEMWNKANEYNSPAAQMARYQSAGLNPNLIYGNGTASAGNTATSLPKYQAPTYEQNYHPPIDLVTALGMYQDFRLKQAQIDSLKQDVYRKDWENYYNFQATPAIQDAKGNTLVEPKVGIWGHKWKLAKSQASIAESQAEMQKKMLASKLNAIDLENEYKDKRNAWFFANNLAGIASKVIQSIGISKFAGKLRGAPRWRKK